MLYELLESEKDYVADLNELVKLVDKIIAVDEVGKKQYTPLFGDQVLPLLRNFHEKQVTNLFDFVQRN